MLYCKNCGVFVDGNPDCCPLCQGELEGEAESGAKYPHILPKKDFFSLSVKIAVMLTVAAVVVCAVADYSITRAPFGWWLYVAAGAISFWFSFSVAVKRRGNIAKSIFFTTLTAALISILWDLGTGWKAWSLNFVLPIASLAAMLAMAIIARIQNLPIEQYIYYLILDIIFGIVPLILIICGAVSFIPLSLACVAASVLSLCALLIFNGKALKAEIIRRTHM
mgnify:FL=1